MANVVSATTADTGSADVTPARVSLSVGRSVIGWAVLSLFLVAAADIPATAELASAFAWLIFVAVLLLYGPSALGTLSTLTRSGGTSA